MSDLTEIIVFQPKKIVLRGFQTLLSPLIRTVIKLQSNASQQRLLGGSDICFMYHLLYFFLVLLLNLLEYSPFSDFHPQNSWKSNFGIVLVFPKWPIPCSCLESLGDQKVKYWFFWDKFRFSPLIPGEYLDLSACLWFVFIGNCQGVISPVKNPQGMCLEGFVWGFIPFSQREFLCLREVVPNTGKIPELADFVNKMLVFCCPSAKIPSLVAWEESGVIRVNPQPWGTKTGVLGSRTRWFLWINEEKKWGKKWKTNEQNELFLSSWGPKRWCWKRPEKSLYFPFFCSKSAFFSLIPTIQASPKSGQCKN